MIKVTVTSTTLRHQAGTSKTTGKPYAMDFQTAWVHTFAKDGTKNPYPEKVEVILDKDKDGASLFYPPGDYVLSPASIYVDQRGNLSVAPRLTPVTPAPVASTQK